MRLGITTNDMDIWIAVHPDNAEKMTTVLREFGFDLPELNAAALAELKPSLPGECTSGYSNSRTCEIGLSEHGGISYQSIVYLVDRCTEKMPTDHKKERLLESTNWV